MVRNYVSAAFRIGPLSMAIFLTVLNIVQEDEVMRFDDLLMFFIIGAFISTIIAIIACFMVFGFFEAIHKHFRLRLKARALFHYFLPILQFVFGFILLASLYLNDDPFSTSLAISSYLSAVLGWCFYCKAKAQMEVDFTTNI